MHGEAFNSAAGGSMIGSANMERPFQAGGIADWRRSLKSTYLCSGAGPFLGAFGSFRRMFAENAKNVHAGTRVGAKGFSAAMSRGAD